MFETLLPDLQRAAPPEELAPRLERLTEAEFEELGDLIINLDDGLRLHAMTVLERVKNPDVMATLAALYEDVQDEIRERALLCLHALGGDSLAEEIVSGVLLEDPVPAVRRAAALALAVSRSPNARRYLLESLHEDEDETVRARAAEQLRLLG